MLTQKQLFLKHVGQTSGTPLAVEVEKAEGIYLYDNKGKRYIDLISGVSVSNVGHRHPKVVEAVKSQLDKYMHLMVYGEYVISPQVEYAKLLTEQLPESLNSVYYVNSGSEAVETGVKLAKRYTGRYEIVAFKNAYHGSTHLAASLMSNNMYTHAYRPLVPGIRFLDYNETAQLEQITEKTAAVVLEYVQAEAGIIPGNPEFIRKLRERCTETGTLLIADEIQTGFGRTGSLFAFQQYNAVPDILLTAKGMGGGMPIGALIADKQITDAFMTKPVLGHITTFGGHPVSAASALASLNVLLDEKIVESVKAKSDLFFSLLTHPKIQKVRGKGLIISVKVGDIKTVKRLMRFGIKAGFLTDWFLFDDTRFRISPPLIITESQIHDAVNMINEALDKA